MTTRKIGRWLQWGRTRVGGERQQRQGSGDDGCGGGRWQRRMTMARQTRTAAENSGMQDWTADYDWEGQ
jgi:hypothetical protein